MTKFELPQTPEFAAKVREALNKHFGEGLVFVDGLPVAEAKYDERNDVATMKLHPVTRQLLAEHYMLPWRY